MKKRVLATLLAAILVLSMLVGCGSKDTEDAGSADDSKGSVYYLNFKPEADAAWQELAKQYTEETGVEVKVVTAASGTYEQTLTSEMEKSSAPTMFQVGTQIAVDTWGDYCYDLAGTDVEAEMTDTGYNLTDGEKVYSVAYCFESYGIIVNKALLKEAGYDVEYITNFETLKEVAEDITARKDELGFAAFSANGLDDSSAWRFTGHLTNMPLFYEFRDDNVTEQPAEVTGAYLENYKNIWDLYINNSTCAPNELPTKTSTDAVAEFGKGQAVFYQNGSWEYAALTSKDGEYAMNPEDLTMIPIYCGVEGEENAALCSGTENCWAVNSKASEEDIKATLDFMKWVVTSEAGTKMMVEQFGAVPFKGVEGLVAENVFCAAAKEYEGEGKYNVSWAFNYTPNVEQWRAGIKSALLQYSNGGDWANVETAFINGWATQYQNQ